MALLRPWRALAAMGVAVCACLPLLALGSGTAAAAAGNYDIVGTWTGASHANGADYPQTWVITAENLRTGAFQGYLLGQPSYTTKGTMNGDTWTATENDGSYESWSVGTISALKGPVIVTGTFHDTNGVKGTWQLQWSAALPRGQTTPTTPTAPSASGLEGQHSQLSSIARTLPSPSHAFASVKSDVANAAVALSLALFITFPGNLFNSTFEENYADIVAWWRKWSLRLFPEEVRMFARDSWRNLTRRLLPRRPVREGEGAEGTEASGYLPEESGKLIAVLLVGALLGSMLDPSFGFNLQTVLSFIGILVAMVVGIVVSALVTSGYHRTAKHGKVPYKLDALPLGLVVAAGCVLISRSTGFEPGYLYGVICGVSFSRQLAKHEEGHLVALSSVFHVVVAVLAWLAWDAMTDNATKAGGFFGSVLIEDFLASLFVSGLVGTLISLFPLRFLPGHKLQLWHRGVWLALFALTFFTLVQVLLRPHATAFGPSHGPLVTTAALFVLFGGGSVLFHNHFDRKNKHRGPAGEGPAGDGVIELAGAEAEALTVPAEGTAP